MPDEFSIRLWMLCIGNHQIPLDACRGLRRNLTTPEGGFPLLVAYQGRHYGLDEDDNSETDSAREHEQSELSDEDEDSNECSGGNKARAMHVKMAKLSCRRLAELVGSPFNVLQLQQHVPGDNVHAKAAYIIHHYAENYDFHLTAAKIHVSSRPLHMHMQAEACKPTVCLLTSHDCGTSKDDATRSCGARKAWGTLTGHAQLKGFQPAARYV